MLHCLELLHGQLCLLLLLLLLILHQQLLLEQLKEGWIANEDGRVEPRQCLRLLIDLLLVQGGCGGPSCKTSDTTDQGWHRGAAATWQLATSCRQCRVGR